MTIPWRGPPSKRPTRCLEYAGWARSASLDELARIYRLEPDRFSDWQGFTESDVPVVISRPPRLILVAREFHGRTGSAFEYGSENGLPIEVLEVSVYEDQDGRRFVDVGVERAEPPLEDSGRIQPERRSRVPTTIGSRRVRLVHLLDADLLLPWQELIWERPRLGVTTERRLRRMGQFSPKMGGPSRRHPRPRRKQSGLAQRSSRPFQTRPGVQARGRRPGASHRGPANGRSRTDWGANWGATPF